MAFTLVVWRELSATCTIFFIKIGLTAMNRRRKLLIVMLLKRRIEKRASKYKKTCWVRRLLRRRKEKGEYANLVREMHLGDHESFLKYFQMSPATFEVLLRFVAPEIIKSSEKRGSLPSRKTLCHSTLFSYWGFPPNNRLKLSIRSFNCQQNHTISFHFIFI